MFTVQLKNAKEDSLLVPFIMLTAKLFSNVAGGGQLFKPWCGRPIDMIWSLGHKVGDELLYTSKKEWLETWRIPKQHAFDRRSKSILLEQKNKENFLSESRFQR